MSGTSDPGTLLEAHRAGDRRAMNDAIDSLAAHVLRPAARRAVGGRNDQVDFQVDSLVQSVLADELPIALEKCDSEAHLRARLVQAIRNKALDRMKKGGKAGTPRHLGGPGDDGYDDPANAGPGPRTEALAIESVAIGSDAFAQFASLMLTCVSDEVDAILVNDYLLLGKEWSPVAQSCGLSEAAARKRMSRMRSKLLDAICQQIAPDLDTLDQEIAKRLLCDRQKPATIAGELAIPVGQVERTMADQLVPALIKHNGKASLNPIWRLVGRLK
ncbi:MAG: hypothetical protein KDA20_05210 [Phycisphaerales bacterium]|nr:hypothetical protein [Phycisphaerales bacterium]